MLTENEKKVLRLLITAFDSDYSINSIAKETGLAPNGAFKILKKFEGEGILKAKKIANIISYKLDFENEKTTNVLELALIPKLEGKIKYRLGDFEDLKTVTDSCILFGSYTVSKKEPHDLDVLFILDKEKFKHYKKSLAEIKDTIPAKIHDVLQTRGDLKENMLKKDMVILDILRTGVVLWGQRIIVRVVKDVYQG